LMVRNATMGFRMQYVIGSEISLPTIFYIYFSSTPLCCLASQSLHIPLFLPHSMAKWLYHDWPNNDWPIILKCKDWPKTLKCNDLPKRLKGNDWQNSIFSCLIRCLLMTKITQIKPKRL
jgi:hypothetical protein